MRSQLLLAGFCAMAMTADAAVLCVRARSRGTLGGIVHVRAACRPHEVQLAPETVGFCCRGSTTTTTTTTTVTATTGCPPVTSTTLGIQDCGAGGGCFGLCSNARACVSDSSGCSCTGPEQPCGPTAFSGGACGGTCASGLTCQLVSPLLPNGCPDSPVCACAR